MLSAVVYGRVKRENFKKEGKPDVRELVAVIGHVSPASVGVAVAIDNELEHATRGQGVGKLG